MKFNQILNFIRYAEAWLCAFIVMMIIMIFSITIGGWWLSIPMLFVALDAGTMVMNIMLNFEGVLFLSQFINSMRPDAR